MSQPLKPTSASSSEVATLQRLRRLSYLLDNAIPIPGTGYRVGLDPLIGLLPGAGDTVAGALSAYIVVEAARLGLPRAALIRMTSNILLETVLGSVPFLGDLFDATWKANAKNMALLEDHLRLPRTSRRADRFFIFLLVAILMAVIIGFATFSILIVRLLLSALGG